MDSFIIDTNVLIKLKNFNNLVFESLWENIESGVKEKKLYSIDLVKNELEKGHDQANKPWNKFHEDYNFFIDVSECKNSDKYMEIVGELERFEEFQKGLEKDIWADPFLIAIAYIEKDIVITEENLNKNPKRKIPYVCEELGIKCMTFDEFMIEQGWKW